jgi:hypothetical protein
MKSYPLSTIGLLLFVCCLPLCGCGSDAFDDPAPGIVADAGPDGIAGPLSGEPGLWNHPRTDWDLGPDEAMNEPPVGENPALGYGPYHMQVKYIHVDEESWWRTAYLFIPTGKDAAGPRPTIVWGHGIWASEFPVHQMEMIRRLVSRGYLVVYPNMDVPIPYPEDNTVTKAVLTYLMSIRVAVQRGLADPEQIIFGGYSFGARVAALATAKTTGLDRFNLWPDPIACVYEAMPDFNESSGPVPIDIPGPRPSEYAHLIDPNIPQTILCAEEDRLAPYRNALTGEPSNGAYFFEQLPSKFAQLIIIKSGTTRRNIAKHGLFRARKPELLDALDLWGHIKIVAGMARHHFDGASRQWAYGFMRSTGGLDYAGVPLVHEVYERRAGLTEPVDSVNADAQ